MPTPNSTPRLGAECQLQSTTFSGDHSFGRPVRLSSWLMGLLWLLVSWGLSPATQAQNFGWARQMGSTSDDVGSSVAVDGSGAVYTTGHFTGTVDFDPGPGEFNLISAGENDVFVSKLDARGHFVWVRRLGGPVYDYGRSVKVDGSGNVYIAGLFTDTGDFDPGPEEYNLTSVGDYDIFVSKLDADGNFVWAKRFGSTMFEESISMAVDGVGNVYITGGIRATVDFDPGPGEYNLNPEGSNDIFVSKLDADGKFVWAKKLGGSDPEVGFSVAVDGSGHVYTTGYFTGTGDFDPGPGEYNLTAAGNSARDADVFVSKLDGAGNFVWAKQLGGTDDDYAYSIAVDGSGNVYTTGLFGGIADFNPGTGVFNLTSTEENDIFVSKLDGSGNFVWAKQMASSNTNRGTSLTVDGSGNVYTTGYFLGTVDFDPGPGEYNLNPAGSADIFVSKLDGAGNFVWAQQLGGTEYDNGYSIAVDGSGSVYTTGSFRSTADFNPGTEVFSLTSAGISDIFVSKLDQLTVVATPDPVCVGSPTTLSVTASGGTAPYSYTWVAPAGASLSATNTPTVSATPTVAGVQTFTVSIAGSDGPVTSTTVSVTANTPPTVSIAVNPSLTIIQGQSTTLTASGADAYQWSTGATSPVISVSVAGPYSVTGTTSGCSSSTSVTVTVLNPATATLTGSTTLCPGQPATLSVALTGTQPWSLTYTDGTTPVNLSGIVSSPYTFTVNPSGTTTYNLLAVATAETPTGGIVSGSATVTHSAVVSPTLTPSSQSVIQNTPFVTLSISGCPNGLNWSGSNATSGTGSIISVPTSATGTIIYSATCVGSCSSSPGSTTVTITPPTTSGSFDGFVNGADCGSFRGWAWDRGKGNTAISIEILDGSTMIGTLLAGDFRQDLLDAGKGNGKHGFRYTIPESIKDGFPHNLSARVTGSGFILKDSPKALICTGTAPVGNKPPQPPTPTVLIAPLAAQVDVPFSGTLAAFTDPEGGVLSYSLSGLPGGLSINASNRIISGTPTEAGSFVLAYSATDPQGATNSVSFVLTVIVPQTTTVTGSFEGYLDKVECGTIRGWVWDRNKPNTPVTVEFYTTSDVLGSVVANIYRDDLKTAGRGNGSHGYSFTVPTALKDNTTRVIYGRVQGSTYVLKDSGKPLICPSPVRLSAESSSDLQVTVFGNPVSELIEVEIRGAEGQPLRIQLTDANGRLASQRQIETAKAIEHQILSVQQQPAGLLLLRVTSGLKSLTLKVVKQ